MHQEVQETKPALAGSNGEARHWKQVIYQIIQELKSKSVFTTDAIGLAATGFPNPSNLVIRVMQYRLNGLENFV